MASSRIDTEIFANLFRAVVDEMAWITLRSSHTTFVKETQDFSTGLITPEGETFAIPATCGASANSCASMRGGTGAFTDWQSGDVLITNDPYTTQGMVTHLNDVYLLRPIFAGGELLCFAWAFIHCTDVGGCAPGSIDMTNSEIFQEGVRIRPMRLYRAGELQEQVWHFLADNSRIPDLNWGDISALVSALDRANERLRQICQRYAIERVRAAMSAILDTSEELARRALARIPRGAWRFTEFFEDDYVSDVPVRLAVELRSDGQGGIELDFRGSDPQVGGAVNLAVGGQRHHPLLCLALIHYIVTHTEGLHFNAGIVRPIELVLPEASVVNASFPAALGMRYATAVRAHDLVLGALAQAVPDDVPVAGSGQTVITYISTSELGDGGARVVVANPVQGGSGGGLGLDGIAGINYGSAFLRNVPVEVLESEVPVIVREFGLRPDSEGPGRWRSGFGVRYELEVRQPGAVVVMRGKDRYRFSAWGAHGGWAGTTAASSARRPNDAAARDLGKKTVHRTVPGETITIEVGGGGGSGSPLERSVELVAADVRDGLISIERARAVYGVITNGDGRVDIEASEALRRQLAMQGDRDAFDLGHERAAWEARYGIAAEEIARRVDELPASIRREAQLQVYAALEDAGAGPYTAEIVGPVIDAVFNRYAANSFAD